MVQVEIESIVKQVIAQVMEEIKIKNEALIPVGVSNKHIHLTREDMEVLFGKGYELTKIKDLQPGQYACKETVEVIGPKGFFNKIRILGPLRPQSQLEISVSDSFKLGIDAPVRESGKLVGTPGIIVKGPKGSVELAEGVIVASRHIHLSTEYAEKYGYKDGEVVAFTTKGVRKATYYNVVLRVRDDFRPELHIDVEEANACGLKNGDTIEIIKG